MYCIVLHATASQKYNPTAASLATTNGPWATGDVIDLAPRMGAALVDLEQVQVHPTGKTLFVCLMSHLKFVVLKFQVFCT